MILEICSKLTIKNFRNLFKVNNKDTRMTSRKQMSHTFGTSFINFEQVNGNRYRLKAVNI